MIEVDLQGRGVVAVEFGRMSAPLLADDWLIDRSSATATGAAGSTVVTVELLRRFGGVAPRALLGATYTPLGAEASAGVLEVRVPRAATSAGGEITCASRLWKNPFEVGLPEDFPEGALKGVLSGGAELPAGTLVVDQAGFDEMNSSAFAFEQAGALLRRVLSASMRGEDVEAVVVRTMQKW
ncbi:hypothetical protein AB0A63_15360 [Lentzea sp. NPDC042327]|uniref:hypothetical protein n=1 Tax=Lentzea sp. NPDC042327 TaxID=3154801 RepID=UPI0033C0CF0A